MRWHGLDMVGAADLFPATGFYHTKGLGFFTIWEGLCPLGGENSAWTHLELLQQSIVWMQIQVWREGVVLFFSSRFLP